MQFRTDHASTREEEVAGLLFYLQTPENDSNKSLMGVPETLKIGKWLMELLKFLSVIGVRERGQDI